MTIFKGSGVALVTPFKEDYSVDYERLEDIIEFQIENGTDAIISCGTTGESATLTDEEHLEVIRFTAEIVNKRVPVIAGTGSNNTEHGINLSVEASKFGVEGLLSVTPYYNKTSQKGLYEHFKMTAEAVDIPIILYNVPGRTSMNLLPETVYELSKIDNIIGIKEASGNLSQMIEIVRLCGTDFDMYSGNDDIIVPTMSIGGKGVISVLANILPTETHNIVDSYLQGETDRSLSLQLKYKELIDYLFVEPNPIPAKYAMKLIGKDCGRPRMPLTTPSQATIDKLEREMKKLGIIS